MARGWILSPVYDLESSPLLDKVRELHTHISLDAKDCSIESALEAAVNFSLSGKQARTILQEYRNAVDRWYAIAQNAGASRKDIDLMADSFLIL